MLPQLVIRHKIKNSGTGSWKTATRNDWTEMQAKALWGYSEYSINYHFNICTTQHYQRRQMAGHLTYLLIKILYSTLQNIVPSVLYSKSPHGRSICTVCHSCCFFKGPWVHIPELSDQALTVEIHGRCQPLFIHIISSTSSGKKKANTKNKISEIVCLNQLEENKIESCSRLQLEMYPVLVG